MEEIKLNQKNVLCYLKVQARPCSVLDIRFKLDGAHGNVYPPSHVLRVLRGLERRGKVRRLGRVLSGPIPGPERDWGTGIEQWEYRERKRK